jgi:hypothetical protein
MAEATNSTARAALPPADIFESIPGVILLDGLLQSWLLGLLLGQTERYYYDYNRHDSFRKRLLVGSLVVLCTSVSTNSLPQKAFNTGPPAGYPHSVQTVLEDIKVWMVNIGRHPWASSAALWANVPVTAIISLVCEAFFIRRCWKMANRRKSILYSMSSLLITIVVSIFAQVCVSYESLKLPQLNMDTL